MPTDVPSPTSLRSEDEACVLGLGMWLIALLPLQISKAGWAHCRQQAVQHCAARLSALDWVCSHAALRSNSLQLGGHCSSEAALHAPRIPKTLRVVRERERQRITELPPNPPAGGHHRRAGRHLAEALDAELWIGPTDCTKPHSPHKMQLGSVSGLQILHLDFVCSGVPPAW